MGRILARAAEPGRRSAKVLSADGGADAGIRGVEGGAQEVRERTMRRRALLAAALILGTVGAARAQTVADIKAKGKLVAGVMVDVPPFALLDENNQPTGY